MKRAAKSQASPGKGGKKSKKQEKKDKNEESRRKAEIWAQQEAIKKQAKMDRRAQQMSMAAGGNGNVAAAGGGRGTRAAAAAAAASSPGTVGSPPRMTNGGRRQGGRSAAGVARKSPGGAVAKGNKDSVNDDDQQQQDATSAATVEAKKTSGLSRLVSFMFKAVVIAAVVAVSMRLANDYQLKDLITGQIQEQLSDATAQLAELKRENERVTQTLAAKETQYRSQLAERDNMVTILRQELEVAKRPETWCRDAREECPGWASVEGECDRNPHFMYRNCRRTCNACHPTE